MLLESGIDEVLAHQATQVQALLREHGIPILAAQ
jgi:hypothetical protein